MQEEPPLISERPDIAGPIIEKFGGVRPTSELTGYPIPRIEGWLRIGNIDEKYRPRMLAIARRNKIPHTPWDYIAHLVPYAIAA